MFTSRFSLVKDVGRILHVSDLRRSMHSHNVGECSMCNPANERPGLLRDSSLLIQIVSRQRQDL